MEDEKHPFDYDPQMSDLEAFTMFLQDVEKLNPAGRDLLLQIFTEKKIGHITVKLDDSNYAEAVVRADMTDEERLNAILDAVEEVERYVQSDEDLAALGQEPDEISVEFNPLH